MREMVKREKEKRKNKEIQKVKGKKRAWVPSPEDDEGDENIPPIASSSQVA